MPESTATDRKPRLLFVEDDAVLRGHLAAVLSADYLVETAGDGTEALLAVMRVKPELVITDIVMPRMDGVELLRTLRSEPNTQGIPVLLISGRARDEQRIEGFKEGADAYLGKPYTELELRAIIASMLRSVRVRKEVAQHEAREQALTERAALLESITDAFFALDRDLRFTYANRRALEHFRKRWDELVRRQLVDIFPKMQYGGIAGYFERVLEEQQPCAFETLSPITGRWVDVRAYPSGEGLSVYLRDIDERKRTERDLKNAHAELAAEVETMSKLYELVTRLLGHTTLAGALEDVLDATLALVGADMGNVQLLNPRVPELEIVAHRGFAENFLDFFRTVGAEDGSACGRTLKSSERVIIEDVDTDPDFRPYRRIAAEAGFRAVQTTPLRSRTGDLLGMISTHFREPHRPSDRGLRVLDLYARQAADFIERMRYEEALEQEDRRKNEFLAVLAHELRNPLVPIRNGIHLLHLRGSSDEVLQEMVNMMHRQVDHLVHLVDDLIDMSRITHGKLSLRRGKVRLREALTDAIEASRSLIEARGHELTTDLRAHEIEVDGDRDRLMQVFSNLLSNSAKYTGHGGRIAVTLDRLDDEAVVEVRDNGIGIAPQQLEAIFEMFSQFRGDDFESGGLGIGLTLVRNLVQMHGGRVSAASNGRGTGSTFTVRLPVARSEAGSGAVLEASLANAER